MKKLARNLKRKERRRKDLNIPKIILFIPKKKELSLSNGHEVMK